MNNLSPQEGLEIVLKVEALVKPININEKVKILCAVLGFNLNLFLNTQNESEHAQLRKEFIDCVARNINHYVDERQTRRKNNAH